MNGVLLSAAPVTKSRKKPSKRVTGPARADAPPHLDVRHTFDVYNGDAANRIRERFEMPVLPIFRVSSRHPEVARRRRGHATRRGNRQLWNPPRGNGSAVTPSIVGEKNVLPTPNTVAAANATTGLALYQGTRGRVREQSFR